MTMLEELEAQRAELDQLISKAKAERGVAEHRRYHDLGINVTEKIVKLIEDNDIPLHWVFGSFGIFARRISITRFLGHYELFKLVQNVPGSIVECGVFQGNGLLSYAKFLEIFCTADRWRKAIGFDTFAGFVEVVPEDGPEADRAENRPYVGQKFAGGYSSAGFKPVLDEMVKVVHEDQYLPHMPRIELVEGDISETVPKYVAENPGLRISMLILDVDLYKPTMAALEHLYPLVVPGGLVVFDEYAKAEWAGESKAYEDFFAPNPPKLTRFNWTPNPGGFFVKE